MSAKSFKNNPALKFISQKEETTVEEPIIAQVPVPPAPPVSNIVPNPAKHQRIDPISWRAAYDGECRERRAQFMFKPSVYEKAISIAKKKGISMNYLFESLILDYVENHPED